MTGNTHRFEVCIARRWTEGTVAKWIERLTRRHQRSSYGRHRQVLSEDTIMNARDVAPEFIPAHIPRELVFDFDYMDDARFKKDLHAGVLSLVEQAPPIFYTPRYGGHWVATTPQAIQDITRNTGLFSSRKGTIGGEQGAFLIP